MAKFFRKMRRYNEQLAEKERKRSLVARGLKEEVDSKGNLVVVKAKKPYVDPTKKRKERK